METVRIDGRVALVGGGSSGVGLACAKGLAELGARTVIVSRSERRAREAVAEIRAESGSETVDHVVADLTAPGSARALVDTVVQRAEGLDILVSAAGSVGETGVTASGVPVAFATNYLAHFTLVEAALPVLQKSTPGRIVIVGAAPAVVKRLGEVDYERVDPTASGSALLRQALAWKLLLAHHVATANPAGPSINVFHPGLIRSNLLAHGSAPMRAFGRISNRFAHRRCKVADHLVSAPVLDGTSGRFIDSRGRVREIPGLVTEEHATSVWEASRNLADLTAH